MMKKIRIKFLRIGSVVCSLALFLAIHSANVACFGKYHQPKFPEGLEKYKK